MILPFVPVVVAPPGVALLGREMGLHVPQRGLVVVEVVVQVDQTGVNRCVGVNHMNVGQLHIRWNVVFPHGLNHAVFDQEVSFVDHVSLAGHRHQTSFQDIGPGVNVIGHPVATDHVLGDRKGGAVSPTGGRGCDLLDGAVEVFDIGRVPPRILARVGQRVHHMAAGIR